MNRKGDPKLCLPHPCPTYAGLSKMTVSSSNIFNLKWGNQLLLLASETFYNCCKINFSKKRYCIEMIGISRISTSTNYFLSCFTINFFSFFLIKFYQKPLKYY